MLSSEKSVDVREVQLGVNVRHENRVNLKGFQLREVNAVKKGVGFYFVHSLLPVAQSLLRLKKTRRVYENLNK